MEAATPRAAEDLATALAEHRASRPHAHLRDVAAELGVSEAELLVATGEAQRLTDARWADLVQALPRLGPVKTMTRNEHAVIEKNGAYEGVTLVGRQAQAVGPDIDLRIFMQAWGFAFAVRGSGPGGPRRSLQIFDASGTSVHKCFVASEPGAAAFETLVSEFAAGGNADEPLAVRPYPPVAERADAEIDRDGLRAGWDGLRDTHEFFWLLRRFGTTRTQALRLAGPERARRVSTATLEPALEAASEAGLKIMIFVGNRGMLQIHSGRIGRPVRARGWLNILDPGFNLHVRDDRIADAWIVRKPTSEGTVTSLELFDEEGETIALLFSKRPPGEEESSEWRGLLDRLERRAEGAS